LLSAEAVTPCLLVSLENLGLASLVNIELLLLSNHVKERARSRRVERSSGVSVFKVPPILRKSWDLAK